MPVAVACAPAAQAHRVRRAVSAMASDTQSILVSSAWFTVAVCVYFRAVATSDRSFDYGTTFNFRVPPEEFERWTKLGLVPWWSYRVVIPTVMVTAPCWFAPIGVGTSVHDVMVLIALGFFLSPLTIPSQATPGPADATNLLRFTGKWLAARLDVAVKTAIVILTLSGVLLLPGFSAIADTLSQWVFPVVQDRPATAFIATLLEGGAATLLLMYVVRLSMVMLHSRLFSAAFGLCLAFAWVQLQWFINEVFVLHGSVVHILSKSLLYTMLISYVADFTVARLEPRSS